MNILIIGGGRLGRKTAELLDGAGHSVALLDSSEDNLDLLDSDYGGVTVKGFPMNIKSLREAGIEGCDAAAVVTGDDNLNITVGQIAKDYFHVPRVIARISDPKREDIFEGMGLQTVCPTNMAGDALVSALTEDNAPRQVSIGLTTVSFYAQPVDRRLIGRFSDEIESEAGEALIGILREDGRLEVLSREQSVRLEKGDSAVFGRKVD